MKTSSRPREVGGTFASRRGHVPQLSISDTTHHVTEAIGDLYGDDDYSKRDSRPLSFISPVNESAEMAEPYVDAQKSSWSRSSVNVNGHKLKKSHTSPAMTNNIKNTSFEKSQLTPSLSLREHASDGANSQFPLNNLDYESNPAAVAQELSNLQALRRMSMDVGNTSDPDLPSFQGVSLMPSVAPTGNDDEDDPSRLFWVPARVHPELAPMEFKTFLENKVQSIKRRSGEQTSLSPEISERNSGSSSKFLRRKKSMLSRQIDNDGGKGAMGYKDGAETIKRHKSLTQSTPDLKISDLQELDALVRDPSKAMRKLTLDTEKRPRDGGTEVNEDMPILPQPPGVGLRRSTRTTYRRGSLRKGERVPLSKRAGSLRGDTDGEESPVLSAGDSRPFPLARMQSEPLNTENAFHSIQGGCRLQNMSPTSPKSESRLETLSDTSDTSILTTNSIICPEPEPESLSRSSTFPKADLAIPRIIETPPPDEQSIESLSPRQTQQFPERSSSQGAGSQQKKAAVPEPPLRSSKRPLIPNAQNFKNAASSKGLTDIAQHSASLTGGSVRTDALTFIPILEEKKADKKSKKEDSENSGSRKPSWGWFKGSDEKEKKDKKKDDDRDSKKSKKILMEKVHDAARLDVLQSTLDTGILRGRESLLLERESLDPKLQEERKKESGRKASGEKKEKDGIFSSLFGGGKKKSDRDASGKKGSSLRTVSPEPPHRQLKPDVDYNWTRFSILEERAIYRMAHIKLANPRRALYSQVLLSNFMYSYLAKVQQMHPHMQIPQSALQKKQEAERRQKEQEQRVSQQQQGEQYRYDYHQGIAQYAEPNQQAAKSEGVSYVDDSQIYDYDHPETDPSHGDGSHRPQSRAAQHTSENGYADHDQHGQRGDREYYQYGEQQSRDIDDDDMW